MSIKISYALQKSLKKSFYGTFLWMGFNCIKAIEPLRDDSLLGKINVTSTF